MAGKNIAIKNETGKGFIDRRTWLNPFQSFRSEMDRLMERFFHSFGTRPFDARTGVFVPQLDVVDEGTVVEVSVELPGIDEKDIEVSLSKDALVIKGEKKEEKEEKGKDYYRSERSFGSFTRSIALPEGVDTEGGEASFKKGVLTVRLPKTKEAIKETKKIPVKTE
ncbi:Hsp20/alpha crystallin family protein [Syntrophorhabdus aromaticivorans]|jgi:HSP20 family protein|uniref:Hsp20/alpha crystallin family protein n=1 Tax=Syntrophorhabdus aromaticivorans TaxID=328301 RepID=UPI000429066D|nr:Hsp20/alpha crystallin family protein [Syntrophorhabdus aromaticivorans]OPY61632.1 MAG: Spore protein SP21 [Syntrophorhabdaceae bacterium PtaU1.Bin034]